MQKKNSDQFEFDWLALALMDSDLPLPKEVRKLATNAGLSIPETQLEYDRLEGLAVKLHYLNLRYGERQVSLADELETVRVLVGSTDWLKNKKVWMRRAKRDPFRIRMFILLMKQKIGLNQPPN